MRNVPFILANTLSESSKPIKGHSVATKPHTGLNLSVLLSLFYPQSSL